MCPPFTHSPHPTTGLFLPYRMPLAPHCFLPGRGVGVLSAPIFTLPLPPNHPSSATDIARCGAEKELHPCLPLDEAAWLIGYFAITGAQQERFRLSRLAESTAGAERARLAHLGSEPNPPSQKVHPCHCRQGEGEGRKLGSSCNCGSFNRRGKIHRSAIRGAHVVCCFAVA